MEKPEREALAGLALLGGAAVPMTVASAHGACCVQALGWAPTPWPRAVSVTDQTQPCLRPCS